MATTSDIRKGLCIKYNSDIFKIIEFLHVKPGKGPAFVRTKLKSVTSGKVIDNTFSAGHKKAYARSCVVHGRSTGSAIRSTRSKLCDVNEAYSRARSERP